MLPLAQNDGLQAPVIVRSSHAAQANIEADSSMQAARNCAGYPFLTSARLQKTR